MRTEVLFSALMKLTGTKQTELAQELGVARSTLAAWLAGYAAMPSEAVLKAHRFFNERLARLRS